MRELYFGPTPSYASPNHTANYANAAIVLNPNSHTAVGTFTYNIYLSTTLATSSIAVATVKLFCGPSSILSLVSPSWFSNPLCCLIKQWTLGPVGAPIATSPAAPVQNCAWAVVPNGTNLPVWNPQVDTPAIFNKAFALVATVAYQLPSGGTQTIVAGQIAIDPCAAVSR